MLALLNFGCTSCPSKHAGTGGFHFLVTTPALRPFFRYLGSRGLHTTVYHHGFGHADYPDSPQEELMTTDQTTGAYPTRP